MKRIFFAFSLLIVCAATALAQKLTFTPSTVNVGSTLWHMPVTAEFQFQNKGVEPVRIEQVDPGCGCLTPTWTQGWIAAGQEGRLSVTYDAALLGHFDRIILVRTSGSTTSLRLRMKGVVTVGNAESISEKFPYRIGDICLSTNNIEFPDVSRGDTAVVQLEIWNDSEEVYTPALMHLPSYITATYQPQMLARAHRGYILLTLHSEQLSDMGLNQTSVYLQRFAGDRVGEENELALSAILLPDTTTNLLYTHTGGSPRISLSTHDLHLGKLGNKKKLKGSVTIKNTGAATLHLSAIQVTGLALQVSLPKRDLRPGESVNMNITLLSRYLPQIKSQPRVLIISNDTAHLKEIIAVDYD